MPTNLTIATTRILGCLLALSGFYDCAAAAPADDFADEIKPLLARYCYDCHSDGANEGDFALDEYKELDKHLRDRELWTRVWDNVRAQIMPPHDAEQPSKEDRRKLLSWIEHRVFGLDPDNPDPGRVTVRRLNRTEYEYTVKDVLGYDCDAHEAFPADDTAYGFDNIGDVLTISPLLMEKYLAAAKSIVADIVPLEHKVIPVRTFRASEFTSGKRKANSISFDQPGVFASAITQPAAGQHRLQFDYVIDRANQMTSNTAWLVVRVNSVEVARKLLAWGNPGTITVRSKADFEKGENRIELELVKGDPALDGETKLTLNVRSGELVGPLDGSYRVVAKGYENVFIDGPPPADPEKREAYLRRLFQHWGLRLWRRPLDESELQRFVDLAAQHRRFEKGFATAMTVLLASPKFLFRAEVQSKPVSSQAVVPVSEYALASRLSYFLWLSAPDEELLKLAAKGELRQNLRRQVDRMIRDRKSDRFVSSFAGQWLRSRDIQGAAKKPYLVLGANAELFGIRNKKEADAFFNGGTRQAMRQETEMMFEYVLREDRSVLEFLTADYTFLNESLARTYQIDGVKGKEMRRVELPPDSPRGGILGQGTFLVLTSNKTRTSPVKRGLFVLENLLATPAPPAPENVESVEEQAKKKENAELSTLQLMERHRADPKCASCHARFDPIGVALDNFNALGMWRDQEKGQPIKTAGRLITGEPFADAKELGQVLATSRRSDFYRCLAEKLMTFAIGRGVEYYDAPTINRIIKQLEADGGKMSTLIYGVVESTPFQKQRGDGD